MTSAVDRIDLGWSARAGLVARYPAGRVLDLGSSWGDYALAFASQGAQVHAVDREPERLALLRRQASERRLCVSTETADLCDWTPSDTYDLVWCANTIQLLSPGCQQRLLRQMRAALAPGGRIFCDFYTPRYMVYRALIQRLPPKARFYSVGVLIAGRRGLRPRLLTAMAQKAGLQIIEEDRSAAYDASRAIEGNCFSTVFGRYFRAFVLNSI